MRKIEIIKKGCIRIVSAFSIVCVIFAGCASTGGGTSVKSKDTFPKKPSWVFSPPVSKIAFIGVGSAALGDDLAATQKLARDRALKNITEQIRVSVVSDMLQQSTVTGVNDSWKVSEVYEEKIAMFTSEILENWEITGTWVDTVNGYYWCKINMDKNTYYNRVNKKIIDCKTLAADALAASERGSFAERLTELCNALKITDDYFGIPLKIFYRGDSVVLNNEIPRKISSLFSGITIKPNVNKLVLGSQDPIPDTVYCSVFFEDLPEKSVSVKWVSSTDAISVSSVPGSFENNHYVKIGSVPPSRDPSTITATLNAGTNAARLVQAGIKIPSASFTILRNKASLKPLSDDPFTMEVVNKLVSESVVNVAENEDNADFTLEVFCEPYGEPALMMGLHKATALVNVKLESSQGEIITELETPVSSNHPVSYEKALSNARRLCVKKAVSVIKDSFR